MKLLAKHYRSSKRGFSINSHNRFCSTKPGKLSYCKNLKKLSQIHLKMIWSSNCDVIASWRQMLHYVWMDVENIWVSSSTNLSYIFLFNLRRYYKVLVEVITDLCAPCEVYTEKSRFGILSVYNQLMNLIKAYQLTGTMAPVDNRFQNTT